MPHHIVHAIGSTCYFVFFVLFWWVSRIPRTNQGANWWAAAMAFGLLARLTFLLVLPQHDAQQTAMLYSTLNVLEKLCLVIGLVRFFDLPFKLRWFVLATLMVEFWLLVAWFAGFSPSVRGIGVAMFNAGMLSCAAWMTWRQRHELPSRLLLVASLASGLLVLHWATGFIIIGFWPAWSVQGFLLGTFLVGLQYLSLLATVLQQFQQRLIEAESRALEMAFLDPLTGLSNQRYMRSLFEQALLLATRPHQLVAIIYIDLDNFKPINDTAGHHAGDEVLKVVASRLKSATRSTDICARLGGDEFVAICTQLDQPDQVHSIADKLLEVLTTPINVDGREHVLGASMGISLYPLHGTSLPALLEYADTAMYHIKRHGKNGYCLHGAEPDSSSPPVTT
ncbi:diguanylate cyclase (GGDEF) domain-containing protein [Andreprevotia lacus DSM 23236]|jgi:diguanylate cyclase (GGDEF)-like protein|uniref:Diguanylate cyclase (GGDEF) domain-containing protein n=1 Tax=Andreprevotia lacus DSM 23236 TaxID=1121001 RepID=A0A1W1XM74_9NEIS|nr:GGDEF domain-containing protein [Andreprevotia lacus]SMC25053.1 diguanylate cyclase (GGDEF) domain-containing protein [Andreprevotia lacus DSM 23236]